jgi:hypothetical protein
VPSKVRPWSIRPPAPLRERLGAYLERTGQARNEFISEAIAEKLEREMPKIIDEWTGDSAGGFTAVVQRTEDGRWIIGTKGTPGNWAGDALDYATDVEAMRRLEEMRGYLPPDSHRYFPPEMLADDYELPPEPEPDWKPGDPDPAMDALLNNDD